jgi:hypothetical protein
LKSKTKSSGIKIAKNTLGEELKMLSSQTIRGFPDERANTVVDGIMTSRIEQEFQGELIKAHFLIADYNPTNLV